MPAWPNLFIAGAPRCGTTSLHAWLSTIPGVFMSRIKEPNYYSRVVIGEEHPLVRPIRDEASYLALFADAGDARYRGEASPNYLEDPEAPALIERTSPGARVIASLRDPVERLFSHYLMLRNNCRLGTFADEVHRGLTLEDKRNQPAPDATTGLYAAQVERYRATFGARFKPLVFEEWMGDVEGTMRELLGFLGIDHAVEGFDEPAQRGHSEARGPLVRYLFGNRMISRTAEAIVPYRVRKFVRNALLVKSVPKPQMDPDTRRFLVDYYRHDVRRLEELLGRRLPWPNFAGVAAGSRAG
jgi:hypothetical protein